MASPRSRRSPTHSPESPLSRQLEPRRQGVSSYGGVSASMSPAVIALVVGSIVGLFYYLRVIVAICTPAPEGANRRLRWRRPNGWQRDARGAHIDVGRNLELLSDTAGSSYSTHHIADPGADRKHRRCRETTTRAAASCIVAGQRSVGPSRLVVGDRQISFGRGQPRRPTATTARETRADLNLRVYAVHLK